MSEISRRERWTAAEDVTLLNMRGAGASVLDIARALGKTYGATQTRVNRKGCGRLKTQIRRTKWTDAEIARVRALKEAGKSTAEIANELGRSEVAVMSKAASIGVSMAIITNAAPVAASTRRTSGNQSKYSATDAKSKYSKEIRDCIPCRKPFMSDWIGNRVCRSCKERNASEGMDD